jgi:leucyl aminopeptidase
MDLKIRNVGEKDCVCEALILPLTEDPAGPHGNLGPSLTKLIKKVYPKEFRGRRNELFLVPAPEDVKPRRILLAGLGKRSEVTAETLRQVGGKAAVYLRELGIRETAVSTALISSLNLTPVYFAEGALLGLYTYGRYKKEEGKKSLKEMTVLARTSKELDSSLDWIKTVASAVWFARDLVNTPANDMTPSHLAKAALGLKKKNLSVKVLERKDVQRLGMGSYLSVAKGSHEPPKFIVLEYRGSAQAPVVLVGKSITFDSGGLSLKPADSMEKMKYDMAGGAAVLGVLKAASESLLPAHLVAMLPATENLPGGSATRPGDVVKAMDGTTIEITNTDAEGRLVVADGIAYARRLKPRAIIDIATLTGACSIALGDEAIAMMGNDRKLIGEMQKSADAVFERVWEMPLYKEYGEYLKSDIADIKNAAGRNGSLVAAASFLSRFAGDVPWVHLDIAGTAWAEKEKPYTPKGASGIGVRLLSHFIREMK